jgi:hypothetical protein
MTNHIEDQRMHDGSRRFSSLPESQSFRRVFFHTFKLFGAIPYCYLADPIECWIDFFYKGHWFTINNQFGEFWFFVKNPNCPDEILLRVQSHFSRLVCGESAL